MMDFFLLIFQLFFLHLGNKTLLLFFLPLSFPLSSLLDWPHLKHASLYAH